MCSFIQESCVNTLLSILRVLKSWPSHYPGQTILRTGKKKKKKKDSRDKIIRGYVIALH